MQNEVNERASALRRRNLDEEEEAKDDEPATDEPQLTDRCSDEDETRV